MASSWFFQDDDTSFWTIVLFNNGNKYYLHEFFPKNNLAEWTEVLYDAMMFDTEYSAWDFCEDLGGARFDKVSVTKESLAKEYSYIYDLYKKE